MQSVGLASVATRYYSLRGLLLLPSGFVLLAAGFTDMPPIGDEPVSGKAGYFAAALVIAVIGYFVVNQYYVRTFGRIDLSTGTKVRVGLYAVGSTVAIGAGILIDSQTHLPLTVYGLAFALSLLAYYRMLIGLRSYHWAFLGGLALLSLAPVWGSVDDKISLVMVPMGLATLATGLFDHRELLRSIEQVRSAAVTGDTDAPA